MSHVSLMDESCHTPLSRDPTTLHVGMLAESPLPTSGCEVTSNLSTPVLMVTRSTSSGIQFGRGGREG